MNAWKLINYSKNMSTLIIRLLQHARVREKNHLINFAVTSLGVHLPQTTWRSASKIVVMQVHV